MNKKITWRKMFDSEDFGKWKLRIFPTWIEYGDIGFDPRASIKDVLKEQQDKLNAIKEGYKKWQEEFKTK